MKKKLILFILISLLFVTKLVKAEDVCSAQELNELKTAASNLTINYEEYVDDKTYLDVKIYNLTPEMVVVGSNDNNNSRYHLSGDQLLPDGSVSVRQEVADVVVNYTFDVYVKNGPCEGNSLRKLLISLPKINYYNQLSMCGDIQDYYLCQKYTTLDLSSYNVEELIMKYKQKINGQQENVLNNNDIKKNTEEKNYTKFYVICGLVIVGVVITFVVIKKRKEELF